MATFEIYVYSIEAFKFLSKNYGRWVEVELFNIDKPDQAVAKLQADIDSMLANCPVDGASMWAIGDTKGFESFGGTIDNDEMELYEIPVLACGIDTYGDAFGVWVSETDKASLDGEAFRRFEDEYIGEFASFYDFVDWQVAESGLLDDIPDLIANYFDYKAYGDGHLRFETWHSRHNNRVYVFHNC